MNAIAVGSGINNLLSIGDLLLLNCPISCGSSKENKLTGHRTIRQAFCSRIKLLVSIYSSLMAVYQNKCYEIVSIKKRGQLKEEISFGIRRRHCHRTFSYPTPRLLRTLDIKAGPACLGTVSQRILSISILP